MKKAQITVFLSMSFILLLSFVLGILQVSVIHTASNLSRLDTDRAVFSLFGEYHPELLKYYQIFAIDGGHGTGEFTQERLLGRIYYYQTGETEHEITEIQFLTDNQGQAFREQVLAYMEENYGIGIVKEFTGLTPEWEEQTIQGENMGKEDILSEYEALKEPAEEQKDSQTEETPFDFLEQIEKSGLLSLVMPEDMELSGREISLGNQPSNRKRNTGTGSFPARQGMEGVEERLLFNEYILKNFENASADSGKTGKEQDSQEIGTDRSLSYEVEYILSGKASDKENLEAVLKKLFFVRMALNYVYLLSDTGKQAEAETMAVTLAMLLFIPQGAEVLKQLILLAWAAGESVVDIRTLLSGKRAALVKTKDTWQLSLSELLLLGSGLEQTEGADVEGGISYEEYLRSFLFLADQDDTTMRTLDRVEENLRIEYGMDFFRADCCVTKLRMSNTAVIFGDLTYTYPVYFGYE